MQDDFAQCIQRNIAKYRALLPFFKGRKALRFPKPSVSRNKLLMALIKEKALPIVVQLETRCLANLGSLCVTKNTFAQHFASYFRLLSNSELGRYVAIITKPSCSDRWSRKNGVNSSNSARAAVSWSMPWQAGTPHVNCENSNWE